MHKIELLLSLADLDRETPAFFREEPLLTDDEEAMHLAREILATLGQEGATDILKEILTVV